MRREDFIQSGSSAAHRLQGLVDRACRMGAEMTFLTDVIQVETTQNGNALELRFSRPVTADDRKSLMDAHNSALNTRPAAPVEGLETVRPIYSSPSHICLVHDDYVTLSQAEDIIAAATAQRDALIEAGLNCCNGTPNPELPRFDLALSFINSTNEARKAADIVRQDLKADNAALTARVKELEEGALAMKILELAARTAYRVCAETRHVRLGENAADAIRALALECSDDISAIRALETQLAAARKALEILTLHANSLAMAHVDKTQNKTAIWAALREARAALEAKP